MEFENAIRKGLPIVVVISNDLGWGMIRHSQEIRIGHAIEAGTFIGQVDYHKMVRRPGGKGYFVEKPEQIRPALESAFASGKTCCINVMTDPTTVSPGQYGPGECHGRIRCRRYKSRRRLKVEGSRITVFRCALPFYNLQHMLWGKNANF